MSALTTARRVTPRALAKSNEQLFRANPLHYLILVVTLILSVFPLYWTLVMASRTNDQIAQVPPPLTPGGNLGHNLDQLFSNPDVAFAKALINSFLVAGTITISVVTFSSLAGFAFAKLKFRGRNGALVAVVVTMMVPIQLGTIPLYMLMNWLGISGTSR